MTVVSNGGKIGLSDNGVCEWFEWYVIECIITRCHPLFINHSVFHCDYNITATCCGKLLLVANDLDSIWLDLISEDGTSMQAHSFRKIRPILEQRPSLLVLNPYILHKSIVHATQGTNRKVTSVYSAPAKFKIVFSDFLWILWVLKSL